jgi:curved DNA-binding protein CbpA
MKDLYKRLGLPSDATEREIRVALDQAEDEALVRAGREVLLRDDRRAVYDRSRRIAHVVAELRANLGLRNAPNGTLAATDFDRPEEEEGGNAGADSAGDRKKEGSDGSAGRGLLQAVKDWLAGGT